MVLRVSAIAASLWLAGPAIASAQTAEGEAQRGASEPPKVAARRHATAGIEAFHAGRPAVALKELRRAEQLYPAVTHRVYMARSLAALGRLVDAAAAYDALLAEPRPARPRRAVREAYAAAADERERLRGRLPQVRIVVDEEWIFEVSIDGQPVSPADFGVSFPIDPGSHRALIARPGGTTREVAFEAVEGQTTALTLVPPDASSNGGTSDGGTLVPAFIAYGLGAGALVAGAVTGGLSLQRVSDIDEQCEGKSCPAVLEDDAAVARDLGNASTVSFVIAGAALTTAVVLTIVRPGGSSGGVAVAPVVGPGFLGLRGAF